MNKMRATKDALGSVIRLTRNRKANLTTATIWHHTKRSIIALVTFLPV